MRATHPAVDSGRRDELEAVRRRGDAAVAELECERARLSGRPEDPMLVAHLEAGEPVLWLGRPVPWRIALRSAHGAVVGVGGLVLVDVLATYVPLPSFFFWIFILELSVALALIVRPFFRAWQARRTRYAVTSRRAVVVTRGLGIESRSFQPWDLGDVTVRSDREGSGDLVFRPTLSGVLTLPRWTEVGFLAIRDVAAADRALRRCIVESAEPPEGVPAPPPEPSTAGRRLARAGDSGCALVSRTRAAPSCRGLGLRPRVEDEPFGLVSRARRSSLVLGTRA